ncbi:reductive dehalogenase [Calidifontibacillus oryziterrae]|uniref:reductive dehalogenase n=1 Tax=Calidifontibacillus oryziterrae TaxID=1191699 RepID=UPI000313BCC8|nr:reductive dehalogenase [Calidifontibacillus oryziterrae]
MTNKTNLSLSEIYKVDDEYERFDQKKSLLIQALWNDEMIHNDKKIISSLKDHIQNNKSGYSLFDFAYYQGIMNQLNNLNFGLNLCDQPANSWSNTAATEPKAELPPKSEMAAIIKKAAMKFGANAVGITELDRRWVYSHWYDDEKKESFPLRFSDEMPEYENIVSPTKLDDGTRVIPASMKYAIVVLVDMDNESLQYAPTMLARAASVKAYADLTNLTLNIAGFIKTLGYNAIPSINCTALSIPLAIDAGLGEMGRSGKLIHPELGAKTRIAKVITDLPLSCDQPQNYGIIEFCQSCKKCARQCPVGALSKGGPDNKAIDDSGADHYLRWVIDQKKCYKYWSECGTDCCVCIYVCPFNRGQRWTSSVAQLTLGKDESLIHQLYEKIDNIDDYGIAENNSNKFWE